MKKNRMMRLASALLVLTLLSTSVISGTFAKYTTSTTGNDKARVAYWGWDAPASLTIELFDDNYDNVASSGEEDGFANVIAPGTGKTATFAFPYTNGNGIEAPEVAYSFEVNANIAGVNTKLDENKNFKWILDGAKYDTVADLKKAIEDLDGNKTYAPGKLPDGFGVNSEHTIGWVWDYGTGNEAEDKADTEMGNMVALENVEITITITATQVD